MKRRAFLSAAALGSLATAPVFGQTPAAGLHLKITGLKTFVVNVGSVNWVFVKIHTNQGLTGLGEGSVTSKEATIAEAIREHERFLVGKDPTEIERLWQAMFRYPRWRGGPVLNSAISAVEIALWDILGKAVGLPIYRLLGGACRDRIRMYVHAGGQTPEEAAHNALAVRERGYTALKWAPFEPLQNTISARDQVRRAVARMEAQRKALGADFDILIDAHGRLTPVVAAEACQALEPLRPFFVEEPTQPEDLDTLAWLGARTRVPLATGERLFTKYGFADLCARHLVSYVQPDVVHAGGILECKKIAAIAEAHSIEVTLHNPQSEVSTLASLHVDACTPNCVIQEMVENRAPWIKDLFFGGALRIKNGYAELPDRPGLGVDLDEKVAAQHPYKPVNRQNWTWEDGAAADS
jgi:galactonate dehydratase